MSADASVLYITFIICIFSQSINSDLIKNNLKTILNNVTSECDSEYALVEFKGYRDENQNFFIYYRFNFLKNLGSDNIFFFYQCLVERKKGEYIYIGKGTPVNVCKFLKKPQQDPFLSLFLEAVNKNGNIIRTCPILKVDSNITVPMADIKVPSFIPPGNYKIIIQVTKKIDNKSHQIFKIVGYVTLVKA